MGVGGSSPDLVSRRTLGPAAVRPARQSQGGGGTNPDIHRTYDNLASYDNRGLGGGNMENYRHRALSTEVRGGRLKSILILTFFLVIMFIV